MDLARLRQSTSCRHLPDGQPWQNDIEPKHHFDLREEILAAQDSPPANANAVEECLAAVGESVRLHLVADVPVGLFLSAGRDSTLLGALAARHSSEPLRTVTLGFAEYRGTALDEVPLAEAVARQLGSRHETRLVQRSEFADERERILAAMDQPSIDGVNTWFVSRAAAQAGLKVALSGLGGTNSSEAMPRLRRCPASYADWASCAWPDGSGRHVAWSVHP